MNFKKLAEQKIDELSGKITPEQILENAENDSVEIILEGLDEITSKIDEEDSEELSIELIPSENTEENSVEQLPRIKKDLFAGYLGELSEAPNPLEYGANATYRNLREGIVYKKGPDNLWEVFVKDGAPGRQGQSAPGGGCGVAEVRKEIAADKNSLGSPSNPYPTFEALLAAYATALPSPHQRVWVGGVEYEWLGGTSAGTAADWVEVTSAPQITKSIIRDGLFLYDLENSYYPRETAIHITPEGLIPISAGTTAELAKLRIDGQPRVQIKRSARNTANKNTDAIAVNITSVGGYTVASPVVNLVTTKLSAVPSTNFRPCFIGDSISDTDIPGYDAAYSGGYGLASMVREFWVRDNVDGLGGTCTLIGTRGNRSVTSQYRGSARALRSFHEGRSGWAASTYRRHPVLLTCSASASTSSAANGAASWAFLGKITTDGPWTATTSQKSAIKNGNFFSTTQWDYNSDLWDFLKLRPGWGGSGSWVDNPTNRGFIDSAMASIKTTPDNPFWASLSGIGSPEFNPYNWVNRYKTMDQALNRLVVGSTAGTKIDVGNLNAIDVIDRPTHFFIELGENDRWQYGVNSLTETLNDLKTIVDGINTAYAFLGAGAPKVAFIFTRGPGKFDPLSEFGVTAPPMVRYSTNGGPTWKSDLSAGMKTLGYTVIDADLAQDPASSANFTAEAYMYTDRGPQQSASAYDPTHPGLAGLRGVAYQCYAWMLSTAVA